MRTKGPGQAPLLVLDVVDVLNDQVIPYAVIGAGAVSLHGLPRGTLDMDVLVSASLFEASSLERAFKEAKFRTELVRGDADDVIAAVLHVYDSFENRVDILLGLRGLDPGAFSRAVEVPFQGEALRFIGREDLIAMKVFAGAAFDLADAESVIAQDPETLDMALVRRLAKRFGREALQNLESVLSRTHKSGGD